MASIVIGVNSYISLKDANAYFSERLYSDAWTAANDDTKTQALIMSARKLDGLPLKGNKVHNDQALAFPRYEYRPIRCNDDDILPGQRRYEITDRIKQAQCEEALALLKGIPKRLELQQQNVQQFTIGNLSETFRPGKIKLISPEARELMRPYMVGSVRII
ncbi:MAG: hypothetical protein Q8920_04460 [Bacillota bacterium]|nr:hypothetical protein [Bacillota bacterium]